MFAVRRRCHYVQGQFLPQGKLALTVLLLRVILSKWPFQLKCRKNETKKSIKSDNLSENGGADAVRFVI